MVRTQSITQVKNRQIQKRDGSDICSKGKIMGFDDGGWALSLSLFCDAVSSWL